MYDLVIFDCDGTLVDSHHGIVTAARSAFSQRGLEVPDEQAIRDRVGLSLEAFVGDLAPDMAPTEVTRWIESYRAEFARGHQILDQQSLFAGIEDLIDELSRRGTLLGIATGKSRRGLLRLLEAHGLRDRFVTLQTADDAPSKPHPGMIFNAMQEAGTEASSTVMIGDTTFDIEAARNAGASAIGVSWGSHPPRHLLAAGARTVVDDVEALRRALELGSDRE